MFLPKNYTIVEEELIWLFNFAEADCGIKSNYNSMVNVSMFGASTSFQDPHNSFILKSVAKKRKIENTFYSLPKKYQKILFSYYAGLTFNVLVKKIYDKLAGPVYVNSYMNMNDLEKLLQKFVIGKATEKEKTLISEIRIEAQNNLYDAVKFYLKLRKINEK